MEGTGSSYLEKSKLLDLPSQKKWTISKTFWNSFSMGMLLTILPFTADFVNTQYIQELINWLFKTAKQKLY